MNTTLSIAFLAGLISFLSPCVLPLIPGYISYINGQTLNDILDDGNKQENQRKVLLRTILFSLGFSLIFISLGATASLIGQSFLKGSNELRWISGLIVIFFSLHMMGLINFKFSLWKVEDSLANIANFSNDWVYQIIIGVAFAFCCSQCIGPILGSILTLAAIENTVNQGVLLLCSYSLGLAIPFVLSGYSISKFLYFKKKIKKHILTINRVGAIILLLTGIAILTNQLQILGFFILEYFPLLGDIG